MRTRRRIDAKRKREFKLPPYLEPRQPEEKGPLFDFIMSVAGEVDYLTALREYQREWCSHPRGEQVVVSVIAEPQAERFEYEIRCEECGITRLRKGRPPAHAF